MNVSFYKIWYGLNNAKSVGLMDNFPYEHKQAAADAYIICPKTQRQDYTVLP